MTYINMIEPLESPVMAPLKLVTMTVKSCIYNASGKSPNINLDVIARHIPLSDKIIGIKYRNMVRCNDQTDVNYHSNTGSGRFKNQCTFVINVGDKHINTKFFNTGKLINVGCKTQEHAIATSELLSNIICNMSGLVIYNIQEKITARNLKKFFKDDLRKKFGELIQLLVCELEMDTNIEPFDVSLSADDSYKIFTEELEENPSFEGDIMYIYTIIGILKCYYNEKDLVNSFNDHEFKYLLFMITEHADREKNEICCEFPSYLNNKTPVVFNSNTLETVLINKSTNCNFYINRKSLLELLNNNPHILKCTFDKNRYPGVIAEYDAVDPDSGRIKLVKIIIFNTGKINITAARTHQQVQFAYDFISEFCQSNFDVLVSSNEYHNKTKEHEDSLPVQHYVGVVEDQPYYLLKKSSIISNPRNIRFLNTYKLLSCYN